MGGEVRGAPVLEGPWAMHSSLRGWMLLGMTSVGSHPARDKPCAGPAFPVVSADTLRRSLGLFLPCTGRGKSPVCPGRAGGM